MTIFTYKTGEVTYLIDFFPYYTSSNNNVIWVHQHGNTLSCCIEGQVPPRGCVL